MPHGAVYIQEYCDRLPKFNRGLSFLGWAYNEEENILEYIRKAVSLLEKTVSDYEIIIVNDGSTDRTRDIILECSRRNPAIKMIDNPGNKGVMFSSRNAIMHASKEFLVWQTVDWSYDISKLRGFLDAMELHGADVAAGVRRAPVEAVNRAHKIFAGILRLFNITHMTKRSDTIWKAVVSIGNYMLIRMLFNVPLSDYQNACIYRTSLLQDIKPESNSSFGNPEYLFKAYWRGAKIIEIPANFIPRQKGIAKGTRLASIKASVWDILRLAWRWKFVQPPAKNATQPIIRLNTDEWPDQKER